MLECLLQFVAINFSNQLMKRRGTAYESDISWKILLTFTIICPLTQPEEVENTELRLIDR
jgi:hypothetical protein